MKKDISRRTLIDLGLRSVAGLGVLSAMPGSSVLAEAGRGLLSEAPGRHRALVCIYGFGAGDDRVLSAPHRLHASLAELQPLYDRNVLAVIPNVRRPARMRSSAGTPGEVMDRTYSALRFLPQGFATLEWAARAARVEPITGTGAYAFATGVSLVAPSEGCPGSWFENSAIRRLTAALAPLRTSFPDSTLGRQLKDVCDLLRVAPSLGMRNQVFFLGTSGMSRAAARAGLLSSHHRQLAQAMSALFAATAELGIERRVTTYTDGDFGPRSAEDGSRMVLGGSVLGGRSSRMEPISQDTYAGAMAQWLGLAHDDVRARFPEFEPAAAGVMA